MSSEERNQRVRDFLRERYGKEPEPLRSYITNDEARELMRENRDVSVVCEDMAIKKYPGKFKQGVEDSIRRGLSPSTGEFWDKARTAYQEYGGEPR
jgi:hypothetical protein